MEKLCPLYFPLYPPSYLLPGLKEYLGDPTPLATTVQPGQLTNPPSIREEEDVHHELSNSKNPPLLVGSRKLVFLHATTSEWCRRRGKRTEGRKEGAVDDRGRGWAVSDEKSRTPQVPCKYLRKYVIKKPNQMAVYVDLLA